MVIYEILNCSRDPVPKIGTLFCSVVDVVWEIYSAVGFVKFGLDLASSSVLQYQLYEFRPFGKL